MFNHQTPRVEFYSDILRGAFKSATRAISQNTLTTDLVELQSQRPLQLREWEDNHGLRFEFHPNGNGGGLVSDETINSLSNEEDNVAVTEAFQEIQSIFGYTDPITVHLNRTKNLLKSVYVILRRPRQRPALKNLLRQGLHGNEKVFRKTWDALLFLARIFFAAVTVVDFTSRLKNLTSVDFVPVPASMVTAKTWPELHKKSPIEALESLECLPQAEGWIRFLQGKGTTKRYMEILRMERTVHAEVQMIYYLKTRPEVARGLTGKVFPYIGCSRKCCFFCDVFRILHGECSARGTHETVFPRWALPQAPATPETLAWSTPLMRGFSAFLKRLLRTMLKMPYPLPHRDLLQQSSAALSTAQALQPEKVSYSERPSTVT